jgi:hypothetical protein
VDGTERGTRQHEPEPVADQAVDRFEVEAADSEVRAARQRSLRIERQPEALLDAEGEQEGDRDVVEPVRREGEHAGGRTVEPLQVVDSQEQRSLGREDAEEAECDRALVDHAR